MKCSLKPKINYIKSNLEKLLKWFGPDTLYEGFYEGFFAYQDDNFLKLKGIPKEPSYIVTNSSVRFFGNTKFELKKQIHNFCQRVNKFVDDTTTIWPLKDNREKYTLRYFPKPIQQGYKGYNFTQTCNFILIKSS